MSTARGKTTAKIAGSSLFDDARADILNGVVWLIVVVVGAAAVGIITARRQRRRLAAAIDAMRVRAQVAPDAPSVPVSRAPDAPAASAVFHTPDRAAVTPTVDDATDLVALAPKAWELNQLLPLLMLMRWPEKLAMIEDKCDFILDEMAYKLSFLVLFRLFEKDVKSEAWQQLSRFHLELFEHCRLHGIRTTREDAAMRSRFESLLGYTQA